MTSHKAKKQCAIENKTLLAQLRYYNCKVLTSAHPQFNSLIDNNRRSRKSLDSLSTSLTLLIKILILPQTRYSKNIILHTALGSLLTANNCNQKSPFYLQIYVPLKKKVEEFQHHVLS